MQVQNQECTCWALIIKVIKCSSLTRSNNSKKSAITESEKGATNRSNDAAAVTGSILKYFSRSALIRWYQREIISTSHKCLLNSRSCFSSTMKGKKTDTSANKRFGQDDENLRACVYSGRAEGRCYVTVGRLKGCQEEEFFSPLFKPEVHLQVSCLNTTFKLSPNGKKKKNPQNEFNFCESD